MINQQRIINLGIEDWLLKFLQRRCRHPESEQLSMMNKNTENIEISYCKRCGALRKNLVISEKVK